MLNSTKILQIYFKPEQLAQLDPAFEPVDNTNNPQPQIQEWLLWDREYNRLCQEGVDYWGFVSWKYKHKMGLTGQQTLDYIVENPGYDVYLFNPAIANEAVFANGWEQGDFYHPGLSDIANDFLVKVGYEDPDVKNVLLDRTRMGFATYFVANRKFWDGYMELSRKIFTEAEKDVNFKEQVFAEGGSGYNLNKSLSNFPFLNERLVGTYMELNGLKILPYRHTSNTLPEKYRPYITEIRALSDLKVLINQYESDELYTIWNHYRHKFLAENPGILNLE
jgi:hypothetical protein